MRLQKPMGGLLALDRGTAVFRNPHTWHGGTPNLSGSPRPIPGIGVAGPGYTGTPRRTMPREIYDGLSARGKQICAKIVATDGVSAFFA